MIYGWQRKDTHTRARAHTHTHTCIRAHTHARAHTHTHAHARTHTHTHTYTFTCTWSRLSSVILQSHRLCSTKTRRFSKQIRKTVHSIQLCNHNNNNNNYCLYMALNLIHTKQHKALIMQTHASCTCQIARYTRISKCTQVQISHTS